MTTPRIGPTLPQLSRPDTLPEGAERKLAAALMKVTAVVELLHAEHNDIRARLTALERRR